MRTRWITLIITMSLVCVADAQEALKPSNLKATKDNQIVDVIPFDLYENITSRVQGMIISQRDLMKKVDGNQNISTIDAKQAQENYMEKLKYLRGLKEQLENAYKSVNPKNTTEVGAVRALANEYLGDLAPLFSMASSNQPNFVEDCLELERAGVVQHFRSRSKENTVDVRDEVQFKGDKIYGSFVNILCPKYSN